MVQHLSRRSSPRSFSRAFPLGPVPRRVEKQFGDIKGKLRRTSENTDRKLDDIRRALPLAPKSS